MIRFEIGDDFLDLASGTSLSIAQTNPIFTPGSIPGTRVYSFTALYTAKNRRILGFPEQLEVSGKTSQIENVRCYLHKTIWQTGTIKLIKASKEGYELSFHANAGDLAIRIKDKKIWQLDLGSEPLNLTVNENSYYPNVNHVMFPVYNPLFYDEKVPGYDNILNDYAAGVFLRNTAGNPQSYSATPFPYLLAVLDKLFTALGYAGISGGWTEQEFIRRVVILNTYSLDYLSGSQNIWNEWVSFSNHLPDYTISKFLIEVALTFGVVFDIPNPGEPVTIRTIQDLLSDPEYVDYGYRVKKEYVIEPNEYYGMEIRQIPDTDDELFDQIQYDWQRFIDGEGEEKIDIDACPALMETIGGRTMPSMRQIGVSTPFELDTDNRCKLKFMLFTGMSSEGGDPYPKGDYVYLGRSLRAAGPGGIVESSYTAYLALKQNTELVTREIPMTVQEFFTFDIQRKIMAASMKYMPFELNARVNYQRGLSDIELKLYKTLL